MNNITILLTIGISLIIVFGTLIGVGRYNNQQLHQDFWESVRQSCEGSGGKYLGAQPEGWKEIWIPCNCTKGSNWSFSPKFACISK